MTVARDRECATWIAFDGDVRPTVCSTCRGEAEPNRKAQRRSALDHPPRRLNGSILGVRSTVGDDYH